MSLKITLQRILINKYYCFFDHLTKVLLNLVLQEEQVD